MTCTFENPCNKPVLRWNHSVSCCRVCKFCGDESHWFYDESYCTTRLVEEVAELKENLAYAINKIEDLRCELRQLERRPI